MRVAFFVVFAALFLWDCNTACAEGAAKRPDVKQLTSLDEANPYYVGRDFARLTTPQWVGEAGVEAVLILSIDDLRDTTPPPLSIGQFEAFLRPILNYLKQIDGQKGRPGRTPVSIMTCQVDPKNALLQTWLKEGVSLETHTFDHPCPLPDGSDFAKAKSTFDRCVDLVASIPGNKPVAFRMPCCDSMNTPSPLFYAEIFNQLTPGKAFLSIDSSVFNITTAKDPVLPKELVTDPDGRERFRKYVPSASFVNTVEDYPYPYVIGKLCWEFPCAMPSDWEGQNLHGVNNPKTVEDWKALLDATVIKQGVMTVVFHPHGWIKSEQIVELIDYASQKYGKKVKFLNFAEAKERLEKNVLGGSSLRAADGSDNGVRLRDVNADGFMDVVIANAQANKTRVWSPKDAAWQETAPPAGPLSPEEALKTFKIYPGYKIELAAAEPQVMDPVAFNWGADGKLWVVEMGDYPLGLDGKGAPDGIVRILEDTDADGKYDKSAVFLDKLTFPTGVTPYRKGVLITCAPDLFYAEDTDGDGRADKREVLFTGFSEGNPQHRLNGLIYGPDNWFYGANGDSGGQIKSIKTGKTFDIGGRDFRINPDTGEIDAVSGISQFGRARDDWGNWFGGNNSNPCLQYVLEDRYIRRNPHTVAPSLFRNVPEVPGPAPVYPISKTPQRFNDPDMANHFTSACGLTFIRDELFGSGYRGNSFVSEPVHNLVHREVIWQEGLLVKSRRADDEHRMEFIASTDTWFRPTMLRSGPDGALYVADMYRAVIEHPEWIPKETQATLDLRAGHDKGRLYRVYPGAKKLRPIPNLAKLDAAGLVAALESLGGWERDMAQQLLVERQDKAAVPLLEKMAGSSLRALARMHALCALDGMNALTPAVLMRALDDPQPGIRAHAVRLSEKYLDVAADVAGAVVQLAKDPDPTVRLQVAYSMGEWHNPQAAQGLAAIALRDAKDVYLSAAVLSSVNSGNLEAILDGVTRDLTRGPSPDFLANLVRSAVGNDAVVAKALEAVAKPLASKTGKPDPTKQFVAVASVLDALEPGKTSVAELAGRGKSLGDAVAKLAAVFDAAREAVIDDAAAPGLRAAGAALLARGPEDQAGDVDLLAGVLTPQTPENVQSAAIASLARVNTDAAAQSLVAAWPGMTPALRLQTLDSFLQRQDHLPLLFKSIESKTIPASDLDAARRRQLLEHADPTIRARAEKVFTGAINPDRQKIVEQFSPALSLKGDPERGKALFTSVCATCHKIGDVGVNVGPDLLSVSQHTPDYYLLHILDPNRAVEARYTNYVVETKNGQTYSGVLVGETGNSVTLTGAGGKPQTVLRADVKRLRGTPLSAMPEGLEIGRTPQEFADLIAFIMNGKH